MGWEYVFTLEETDNMYWVLLSTSSTYLLDIYMSYLSHRNRRRIKLSMRPHAHIAVAVSITLYV